MSSSVNLIKQGKHVKEISFLVQGSAFFYRKKKNVSTSNSRVVIGVVGGDSRVKVREPTSWSINQQRSGNNNNSNNNSRRQSRSASNVM